MMRLISFLIITLFLFSCSSDDVDTSNIVGEWKLIQVLADPGDGSGTFQDVDSDKTITFLSDETFSSSGNLCFFSPLEEGATNGFIVVEDEKIYPTSCDSFTQIALNYKMENGTLTVFYQCIEACAEKYVKIR